MAKSKYVYKGKARYKKVGSFLVSAPVKKRKTKSKKKPGLSKYRIQYLQTGKRKSLKADRRVKAKHPGYRKSKSGKTYKETRRNRSDTRGTRT